MLSLVIGRRLCGGRRRAILAGGRRGLRRRALHRTLRHHAAQVQVAVRLQVAPSVSIPAVATTPWRMPRCREDVLIRVLSSPGCFVCVLCFARFNALASGADGESCYALPLEVRERVWPEPRPSPRSTPSLIIAWSFVWWNKVGYTIRSARASAWAPGRQSRRAPAGCWLRALRTS